MIPELLFISQIQESAGGDSVWHSHDGIQVGCVLAGQVRVHFPQVVREVRRGDFYAIKAGQLHRVEYTTPTREYQGFCELTSAPHYFSSVAREVMEYGWVTDYSIFVRSTPSVVLLCEEMESLWKSVEPSGRLLAQCALQRLFHIIKGAAPELIHRGHTPEQQIPMHEYHNFQAAMQMIEKSYSDHALTVPAIAEACAVSRSLMDQLFNKMMGYGPKRFLQRYRVDRAKELLREREYSMAEIAERTGFPDVFAFSRVFKRITGLPPTRYLQPRRRR